ncbi:MAG: arginine--tRNA ligase, partial [Rickettsiales bacterium]|nr:arginine--tRNA ligase [Rickettsiales bacterium]
MNLFDIMEGRIKSAIGLPEARVEVPKNRDFGDFTTTAAMAAAKRDGLDPRAVAGDMLEKIGAIPEVDSASIAGPGFVNIVLKPGVWDGLLGSILASPETYGDGAAGGERMNVEFVSANPTGPLHIGHARGAVYGDAVARLLEKAGYAVTREYYINDYGKQVETLARSVYFRYMGEPVPEGFYPGEYVAGIAGKIRAKDGARWEGARDAALEYFRSFAVSEIMGMIRADMASLGIRMDVYTSERALVESGAVAGAMEFMGKKGLLYKGVPERPKEAADDWEAAEATLFRSGDFGDDADRVVMRSDGSLTYFASDIAYHFDKFERGFGRQLDVWGADHYGYVRRMKAAVSAITGGEASLDVKLTQVVSLLKDGKPVRMSKRAGNFVMICDVLSEIDADALRLFMLSKTVDAQMSFDLNAAREESRDNPVYYINYAHTRASSLLRKAELKAEASDMSGYFAAATRPERAVVRALGDYPHVVAKAAAGAAPQ